VPSSFNATVQHTWALILSLANNIPRDQSLITGGPGWISHLPLNTFIGGKTLGLLGLGRLGFGVARIATLVFGINVLAWSPNLTQAKVDEQIANDPSLPSGCITVAKSQLDLFASSDILSIHLVLSDRSRGIVTKAHLEAMPPTSFLINTSRGPLIAEEDLLEVLTKGGIRGFATDVFDIEPLPANSRWRTEEWGRGGRSQVVMTPHTGYSFEHTLKEMWQRTRENLDRLVRGEEPQWPLE
jgi:glycerate dehydrogenase